jgi:hypothetical protein
MLDHIKLKSLADTYLTKHEAAANNRDAILKILNEQLNHLDNIVQNNFDEEDDLADDVTHKYSLLRQNLHDHDGDIMAVHNHHLHRRHQDADHAHGAFIDEVGEIVHKMSLRKNPAPTKSAKSIKRSKSAADDDNSWQQYSTAGPGSDPNAQHPSDPLAARIKAAKQFAGPTGTAGVRNAATKRQLAKKASLRKASTHAHTMVGGFSQRSRVAVLRKHQMGTVLSVDPATQTVLVELDNRHDAHEFRPEALKHTGWFRFETFQGTCQEKTSKFQNRITIHKMRTKNWQNRQNWFFNFIEFLSSNRHSVLLQFEI